MTHPTVTLSPSFSDIPEVPIHHPKGAGAAYVMRINPQGQLEMWSSVFCHWFKPAHWNLRNAHELQGHCVELSYDDTWAEPIAADSTNVFRSDL